MFSLLRLNFDESNRQRRDITPLELEMYKRALRRELQGKRKHAATCATLACILVSGSLLLGLGAALTCSGLFVQRLKSNPMPWLVTGPTCIVVGVLVLLLSVEIIIKKKKVAIDDLSFGPKKPSSETTVKVKAIPLWRGMDKAKITGNKGTLPPLTEEKVIEAESDVSIQSLVTAQFQGPSSSSYSSTTTSSTIGSSPSTSKASRESLTPLETDRSMSMLQLDPAKLDRRLSRSSDFDGNTTSSELLSSASNTSCETREPVL